jgi:double-strand break repair protein MRE11
MSLKFSIYMTKSVLRVKHGPQEFVPEGMFDDSIDLVIWGHEHDCRIVPEPVGGKEYVISQPGSSIATSLADGEALPKCVIPPFKMKLELILI